MRALLSIPLSLSLLAAAPAMAQQATSGPSAEEWIGLLATPVKPDPQRGLKVVPGIEMRVQFAFGSAALTEQSKLSLDELGKALVSDQLASFTFRINGHTDAVGERPFNQSLSEARAAAVETYLVSSFAIEPERLVSVGLGEDVLLNKDDPDAEENRRVEIMNVGPAQ